MQVIQRVSLCMYGCVCVGVYVLYAYACIDVYMCLVVCMRAYMWHIWFNSIRQSVSLCSHIIVTEMISHYITATQSKCILQCVNIPSKCC